MRLRRRRDRAAPSPPATSPRPADQSASTCPAPAASSPQTTIPQHPLRARRRIDAHDHRAPQLRRRLAPGSARSAPRATGSRRHRRSAPRRSPRAPAACRHKLAAPPPTNALGQMRIVPRRPARPHACPRIARIRSSAAQPARGVVVTSARGRLARSAAPSRQLVPRLAADGAIWPARRTRQMVLRPAQALGIGAANRAAPRPRSGKPSRRATRSNSGRSPTHAAAAPAARSAPRPSPSAPRAPSPRPARSARPDAAAPSPRPIPPPPASSPNPRPAISTHVRQRSVGEEPTGRNGPIQGQAAVHAACSRGVARGSDRSRWSRYRGARSVFQSMTWILLILVLPRRQEPGAAKAGAARPGSGSRRSAAASLRASGPLDRLDLAQDARAHLVQSGAFSRPR